MNCPTSCSETISSKCVEFDVSSNVFDRIVSIDEHLKNVDKLFDKTIDSKKLGVGSNLVKAVQKLIDESNKKTITTATEEFLLINLGNLGTDGSRVTQEQLNKILVDEIINLKNKLSSITIHNNY